MFRTFRVFTFIIFCSSFFLVSAQQQALLSELEKCKEDACRAAVCQRIAKSYIPLKDYDNILFYFEKEFVFRQNLPDTGMLAIEKSKNYFNTISLLIQTGAYERAEILSKAAVSYNTKIIGQNTPESADAYKQYAQVSLLTKMPEQFSWAIDNALKIRKNEKIPDANKISDLLILQAAGQEETGDLESAENTLNEALSLYHKSKINDEKLYARLLLSLGAIASLNGRFADAINYTKKSIEIRLKDGKTHALAKSYANLGASYLSLKQYDAAISQLEESVNIKTALLGEDNPSTIESKSNLASAYIEVGNYEKAKKILSSNLSLKRKESYYFALWQMAEIEIKLSNHSKVVYYYSEIERELIKIYGKNHPKLAELYLDFGLFYKEIGQHDKAKEKFNHSLNSNRINNRVSDPLMYLGASAGLLSQISTIDQNVINQSFEQIEKIWNNCRRDVDYSIAIEKIRNFYEALLLNIYNNSSAEKLPENLLLNCFESVKSLQLLTSLSETEKLRKANVPDKLINDFKNLKNETIFFEQQWLDAEFTADKSLSTKFRKLFEEKEAKYLKLKASLEKSYQLKVNTAFDSKFFAQLRNSISEKELFLHYFVGEQNSFLLAFNSKKMSFRKIDIDLVDRVKVFTETLLNVDNLEENLQQSFLKLSKASSSISKALLPEKSMFQGIDKITVSPDALLFYIPFEILYYEEPVKTALTYAAQPYLLRNFAIRYAYSLQVLSKQKSQKNRLQLTALAPHYNNKIDNIQELRTNAELKNLSDIYSGSFYSKQKITKSDLLKIFAQKPDILHLAMHAAAPDSSGAYFFLSNSEQLEIFEISGFNLDNTALIVLSACETGLGVQTKGEGLMSLGRAFAYSGAASVVNTLWPLHDHSAVELIKAFYANLDRGMTKSQALRMAKLEFLDKAGNMMAHPLFWAAPVLWGNDEPIQIQKKSKLFTYFFVAASILLISAGFYLLAKRILINKKSKQNAA